MIESAFFFFWTYQNRVNANHTAPFADHFDLVIADVTQTNCNKRAYPR
jgi:hypothetical protein